MKYVLLTSLLFFSIHTTMLSQVNFETKTLDEVPADKPIFVDVFTTWCGPCKKMDKTTFQDSEVSALLNENFTNLKWDAEDDKFRDLVKEHNVMGYPTVLFFNSNKELISTRVGYQDAESLTEVSINVMRYVKEDPLKGVKVSTLSLDETIKLLSDYDWLKSPLKNKWVDHAINHLGDNNTLWKEHFDILAPSAYNDINFPHLEKLVKLHEPLKIGSTRSMDAVYASTTSLKDILKYRLAKEKKSANLPGYEKISMLRELMAVSETANPLPNSNKSKLVRTDRLDYYEYHKLTQYYKPLADSLIAEYILPHAPKIVAESDVRRSKQMSAFLKKINEKEERNTIDSTSITFYKRQHSNGVRLANRLDDVANTITDMYSDKKSIQGALKYASLAYDYAPLPKYLLSKAKVLSKLGENEKAVNTLIELKKHKFYDDKKYNVDELIKSYKEQ